MTRPPLRLPIVIVLALSLSTAARCERSWLSHPPTRPLPQPSPTPLGDGPSFFVDPHNGSDDNPGSPEKPWNTLGHSLQNLKPGTTLYLRKGSYREHVSLTALGTPDKPITIRGYPNELAILDGGIADFFDNPKTAWQPCPGGVEGEFHSTKLYPDLGPKTGSRHVVLLGHFGDSMVPLQGYWNLGDLQSSNPYFNLSQKGKGGNASTKDHVYCGPGIWYNTESKRIHCRLAHTKLSGLGNDNYRGETDPRKHRLVIAALNRGSVLTVEKSAHLVLRDLTIRGARQATLSLVDCDNLELDGLTVYGGSAPIRAVGVHGLRISHTACRGLAAPWTFRGSLKYRSIESRLFTTTGWNPTGDDGSDFEICYSEFTDSVDGVFIGNIARVHFHHNLVDNLSDDGLFVTANTAYDGKTRGGGHRIYQNRFARCLSTFAFGVGHGRQKTVENGKPGAWDKKQHGAGLTILRNVFDFRRPVMYYWPSGPDAPQEISSLGRFAGDHGSPGWEPMTIVHNTLVTGKPPRYEYGTDGFSKAMASGTRRRIFNNIICQLEGLPGQHLPPGTADYEADANLLWGVDEGPKTDKLPRPRYPRGSTPPQKRWTKNDTFADPKFVKLDPSWRAEADLRLRAGSPAIDAGVELTPSLSKLDPIASKDTGRPDIGAIPHGLAPWRIGCRGRLDVFGNPVSAKDGVAIAWSMPFPVRARPPLEKSTKPVAIVEGYPAFEAPLIRFALRQLRIPTETHERRWLPATEYEKYRLVVITGSLARAKTEPRLYTEQDLARLTKFLESGGTLLLTRGMTEVFASPEGRQFLAKLIGPSKKETDPELHLLQPRHPWIGHIDPAHYRQRLEVPPDPLDPNPKADPRADSQKTGMLDIRRTSPLRASKGERLIGSRGGLTTLYQRRIGKGRLVYIGWDVSASLPSGRKPSTVEDEARFEEQMGVWQKLLADVAMSK